MCQCKKRSTGSVLYGDIEGTFDKEWAQRQGLDITKHLIYVPEYGEQGVDVITSAILEDLFDVIIVDSIAQMVPQGELEKSAEEVQMPEQAKMMNRAFRKWQSALMTARREGKRVPTMFFINQPRFKFVVHGDNMTLSGGNGQHFYTSIKIRIKNQKVHAVKDVGQNAYQEVSGVIVKNKTYAPKQEFTFHLALVDYDCYKAGQINNSESLIKYGRRSNFIKCGKKNWFFDFGEDKVEAGSKEELVKVIEENRDIYNYLYQVVLKQEVK